MMKLYLSTVFENRDILLPVCHHLRELGHEITSSWLDQIKPQSDMIYQTLRGDGTERDIAFTRQQAKQDHADIDACEIFVVFIDKNKPSPRGGTDIETGYALGKGKEVWIVGDKVSHFHWAGCPAVRHYTGVHVFLECIQNYTEDQRAL